MASVLVPLAEGCEELEAVTIIDLLRRAGVDVISAGLAEGPVKASRGVVLLPDTTLEAVMDQSFDMIVLPGGLPGATNLNNDPRIHQLLKSANDAGQMTAAICAAPKVLADAGLLDGHRATSYPGILSNEEYPQVELGLQPVVRDGTVITSRGPGTAMDFSLELIEALCGPEQRQQVAAALQREEATA